MLKGLKVSSFACKCVFYRPEHDAKGRPHGTETCNNAITKYTIGESSKSRQKMGSLV